MCCLHVFIKLRQHEIKSQSCAEEDEIDSKATPDKTEN